MVRTRPGYLVELFVLTAVALKGQAAAPKPVHNAIVGSNCV